jgi:hypothetical protein
MCRPQGRRYNFLAVQPHCAACSLENRNDQDMVNLQRIIKALVATSEMGNEWQPEK